MCVRVQVHTHMHTCTHAHTHHESILLIFTLWQKSPCFFSENNPSGKASCISKDWHWKAMTSIPILSSLSVPAWESKQDLQKEVSSLWAGLWNGIIINDDLFSLIHFLSLTPVFWPAFILCCLAWIRPPAMTRCEVCPLALCNDTVTPR